MVAFLDPRTRGILAVASRSQRRRAAPVLQRHGAVAATASFNQNNMERMAMARTWAQGGGDDAHRGPNWRLEGTSVVGNGGDWI